MPCYANFNEGKETTPVTPEEQKAADEKARLEAEKNKKVVFDDDQQKKIQEIIDGRLNKVKEQHSQELQAKQTELDNLKAELEEMKKPGKKGKNEGGADDDESRKQYKELIEGEKNKALLEKQKREKAESDAAEAAKRELALRKEVAMNKAMGKLNFVDTNDVIALTGHLVEFDKDSNTFVVKENGKTRQNSELNPMTLEEFYADFAARRPYLVRGNAVGGAGSTEGDKQGTGLGVVSSKEDLKKGKSYREQVKAIAAYIDKFGREAYEKLPLK